MNSNEKNELLLAQLIYMFQTASLQHMGKLKNPATDKPWDVRSVGAGSYLLQERDLKTLTPADIEEAARNTRLSKTSDFGSGYASDFGSG